jgi:hypothetical protein
MDTERLHSKTRRDVIMRNEFLKGNPLRKPKTIMARARGGGAFWFRGRVVSHLAVMAMTIHEVYSAAADDQLFEAIPLDKDAKRIEEILRCD